jgi:hypothetical protein
LALNPVSLTEALRPWRLAGVEAFLFDAESLARLLAPATPAPTRQRAPEAAQRCSPEAAQRCSPEAAHRRSPDPAPSRHRPELADERRPTPPTAPAKPAGDAAPAASTVDAPQPSELFPDTPRWPSAWAALFARTPQAPLVWTYPELGADLSGQGDKARAACLRELIGSLGLPRGSSAFWPLSLPDADPDSDLAQREHASPAGFYFRQGIHLLQPHGIILFGRQALAASGLPLPLGAAYSQSLLGGVLHLLLPDFATILASPADFSKTAAYLRASLASLPALFRG